MVNYYKVIDNEYIVGFGTHGNESVTEIIEIEYYELVAIFSRKPTAPAGYEYKLRNSDLEWVLVEAPTPSDDDATEEDFISALNEMGVEV